MSRIDIQEVRAFQHALKTANTTMRTRIEKMKAVALQYAGDTSLSGQAVESSKAYFQENYSAICDVLTEILNTSEDLLANYLNAFSAQVDSSPNAKIDAELLGEAVLKVKSIRRKQEALKQSLSGSTAGLYEGRAQTLRLDFVEAVEQEKILEKYLQFEQSYGNYFQDLLALVMTAKRTMQSLIRDVQFNDKTGTYVMPKGYSQTLASMKKRLDTVRGIDARKQEALKEYDVIAVVYQDHYGKPQVMWLLEQNGVGVSHPELKKYLDKTGKYLNSSDYQIITNEELNKKINQSWQKGIYYIDGTKYSGAIGGTLRASAYVESVKGTLDESGLTDAVLGLGLSIAAIRGSMIYKKGNGINQKVIKEITNPVLEAPRFGSGLKVDEIKPVKVKGSAYDIDPLKGKLPTKQTQFIVNEFPNVPKAHGFSDIIDNYAGLAEVTDLGNAKLYQVQGSQNGIIGRFEWIIQDGKVTHRMFIRNPELNGVPIK
ncbi:hypothetical protein X560_1773 [Listeria fleischmannii 1991]|uniref:Bacillus transposase protein n=2 Tax=Listeria fleischmannii TaxID=1069827 RepID=A0A2X3H3V0_9LIST|nr:T7SS effector LXG polymorphic toxin [Listeria fleischmannii]KMT59232.1 hypothetical protein X560_1773 [Listeria fleischmannii 1991]SQC67211.1 Bacillus transposase protein [Listeria fleischmannii subsp. fleischmannii]